MQRKTRFQLGLIILLTGFFLLFIRGEGISGAAIGLLEGNLSFLDFLGFILMMIGTVMVFAGRYELEVNSDIPKVYISTQAINRARKDSHIKNLIHSYEDEIRLIAETHGKRVQAEEIGEFTISPRSRTKHGIRVAWHRERDSEGNQTIKIDDLLYHDGDDYVGRWNRLAGNRKVTRKDYSGYQEYTRLELILLN